MCELCARPEEKTVLVEIRNIHERSWSKYEAGVDALAKAMGFDAQKQQKEVSPFRSVRDLEQLSKSTVEKGLLKLYNSVVTKWIDIQKAGTDAFLLNGSILLNPKTGQALTEDEWKIIKKDVLKTFDYIYETELDRIALHAMSLGIVLKGMPLSQMVNTPYASLKDKVADTMAMLNNPEYKNTSMFAKQKAAENIADLTNHQYRKMHDVIQTSIVNRDNSGTLKSKLFETFGEMNRDWRMIAETEIGNAQNNGQIIAEMERTPEGKYTFMRGVSASEACPWCRNEVDGVIVVALPMPPISGDSVEVDGKSYTAIWPGKSNVGRNRRNWWVASGAQHPHCRCTWVAYTPGFEKYDEMFRDAMAQAAAGYTGKIKYPQAGTTEKPVPWKP